MPTTSHICPKEEKRVALFSVVATRHMSLFKLKFLKIKKLSASIKSHISRPAQVQDVAIPSG